MEPIYPSCPKHHISPFPLKGDIIAVPTMATGDKALNGIIEYVFFRNFPPDTNKRKIIWLRRSTQTSGSIKVGGTSVPSEELDKVDGGERDVPENVEVTVYSMDVKFEQVN